MSSTLDTQSKDEELREIFEILTLEWIKSSGVMLNVDQKHSLLYGLVPNSARITKAYGYSERLNEHEEVIGEREFEDVPIDMIRFFYSRKAELKAAIEKERI